MINSHGSSSGELEPIQRQTRSTNDVINVGRDKFHRITNILQSDSGTHLFWASPNTVLEQLRSLGFKFKVRPQPQNGERNLHRVCQSTLGANASIVMGSMGEKHPSARIKPSVTLHRGPKIADSISDLVLIITTQIDNLHFNCLSSRQKSSNS